MQPTELPLPASRGPGSRVNDAHVMQAKRATLSKPWVGWNWPLRRRGVPAFTFGFEVGAAVARESLRQYLPPPGRDRPRRGP